VDWYRTRLAKPAKLPSTKWNPVLIGPTWQTTPTGHWLLPERTIGWDGLGWCGRWLQHQPGRPWRFTLEQARFLLWWFSVDPTASSPTRDAVLQRLKGWGKDPFAACLLMVELLGPCRVHDWGPDGQPLATTARTPGCQIAAVSLDQTKNTMRFIPNLITAEAQAPLPDPDRQGADLRAGRRAVPAGGHLVADHARGRPRHVRAWNETQHWDSSNQGHDMAEVIERNATKSAGGAARTLRHHQRLRAGSRQPSPT
jgi:hypothetical protein